MNEDLYMKGKEIDLGESKNRYDTLYICAKRIVIANAELDIKIDLKGKVNQFNKIIIDGITFVKEDTKDE